MSDKLMALFAYAVMTAFLLILVWKVPRLDLGLIILATLVLAGIDTLQVMRSHDKTDHPERDRVG